MKSPIIFPPFFIIIFTVASLVFNGNNFISLYPKYLHFFSNSLKRIFPYPFPRYSFEIPYPRFPAPITVSKYSDDECLILPYPTGKHFPPQEYLAAFYIQVRPYQYLLALVLRSLLLHNKLLFITLINTYIILLKNKKGKAKPCKNLIIKTLRSKATDFWAMGRKGVLEGGKSTSIIFFDYFKGI